MAKYIALVALSGFLIPLQALMNARTSSIFGSPFWATLVNFVGGIILLIPLIMLLRLPSPTLDQAGRIPFYCWFSGFIGVIFVAQAAFTVPKLGAAGMMSLVIAGQLIGSITLDHFGVLHTADPVNVQKVLGALMLVGGALLILRPGG